MSTGTTPLHPDWCGDIPLAQTGHKTHPQGPGKQPGFKLAIPSSFAHICYVVSFLPKGIRQGLFPEADLSWMQQVDIMNSKEIHLAQTFGMDLGKGESECLTIAVCHHHELLTKTRGIEVLRTGMP